MTVDSEERPRARDAGPGHLVRMARQLGLTGTQRCPHGGEA